MMREPGTDGLETRKLRLNTRGVWDMNGVQKHPWWRRGVDLTPTGAILIGIAFGSVVGGLIAFPLLDGGSYVPWLMLSLLGGAGGNMVWLCNEQGRGERFQENVRFAAVMAILLAFPVFCSQVCRSGGGIEFGALLLGGICGASMLIVGVAWGFMQLVEHLSSPLRRDPRAGLDVSSEGVWDRDLDQDRPADKRDA
jgi:hypothetical protein